MAFEVNTAYNNAKADGNAIDTAKEQEMFANLRVSDIFHYAFNYVGVLTGKNTYNPFFIQYLNSDNISFQGPYFRYRTFCDYFDLPFRRHVDAKAATLRKFMYVPLFAAAFLAASHFWPLSVSLVDKCCLIILQKICL